MGGVSFTVLPPFERHYSGIGNYSLGVLVSVGNNRLFFAGDAEKRRTAELLEYQLIDIDIFVIPNHGRYNSNSEALIKKLTPA